MKFKAIYTLGTIILAFLSLSTFALRLMIIGDSVDRMMVEDWCSSRNTTVITDKNIETSHTTAKYNETIAFLKQRFARSHHRFNAWEFRVCYAHHADVNISFVMNKCGVQVKGPFWMPLRTMQGIESQLQDSESVATTMEVSIGTAVDTLSSPEVLGGSVDALILHSTFWDLGRLSETLLPYGGNLSQWANGWAHNASELMRSVRRRVPAQVYLWRQSTTFRIVQPPAWHTRTAHNAKQLLDARVPEILATHGYELVSVTKVKGHNILRDFLHPGRIVASRMFAYELQVAKNCVSRFANGASTKGCAMQTER